MLEQGRRAGGSERRCHRRVPVGWEGVCILQGGRQAPLTGLMRRNAVRPHSVKRTPGLTGGREGRCLQRQASVLPCAPQTSARLLRPRVLRVTEATHASRHCCAGYVSARARVNAMLLPVRPSLSLLAGITQDPGNQTAAIASPLYHGGKKSSTLTGQGTRLLSLG